MAQEERVEHINKTLQAMQTAWPFFMVELKAKLHDKTESLITQNDDEARGAIKMLRELMELPEALQQERRDLTAELPDSSDSAFD